MQLNNTMKVNSMTKNIVEQSFLTEYEKITIRTALRSMAVFLITEEATDKQQDEGLEYAKILHILEDDWGGKFVVRKMTVAEIEEDKQQDVDIPASG
jgi:hypothetical protein